MKVGKTMGKKSRFVQQQQNNRRLQNKAASNMNHSINKSNRRMEAYKEDYERSIREIMSGFIKDSGLDPDKIPSNSRILIYELLKKNIKDKATSYELYIKDHLEDENINEYYDAQRLCQDSLEQIDWIYNWTEPIDHSKYDLGEGYEVYLEEAEEKLQNHEKKFDSVLDIPVIIRSSNNEHSDDVVYDFYRFCKFICKNDLDKYYIYISNTIKNLKILNTEDPIKEFMLKPYVNVETSKDCE